MFCKLPVLRVTLVLSQECYITYSSGPVDLNFKWVLMPFKRKEDESAGDTTHTLNNYLKKCTVRIRCRAELWGHIPQQSSVAIKSLQHQHV